MSLFPEGTLPRCCPTDTRWRLLGKILENLNVPPIPAGTQGISQEGDIIITQEGDTVVTQ